MIAPISEMGDTVDIRQISKLTWELTVYAPRIASTVRAGQFVHVRVVNSFEPFLRRPLSVGPAPAQYGKADIQGLIRLLFTVRGLGTVLLADKKKGDSVDLIGPLGQPFTKSKTATTHILVAGGIGVVPLLMLDEEFGKDVNTRLLLGVQSSQSLPIHLDEIAHRNILISTDDGSMGYRGNVIQFLEQNIDELQGEKLAIYGCGPGLMMAALKRTCINRGVPAQVSLEVPMGCGIGACQSCAVPRSDGKGYKLVCKDGPVFDVNEIDLSPELLP